MKRVIKSVYAALFLILFSSCVDLPEADKTGPEEKPGEENANFNWKITESLTLEVKVKSQSGSVNDFYRTVKVYTANSFESTALIATGTALPSQSFKTSISIPTFVNTLYIEIKEATGKLYRYRCEVVANQGTLVLDAATAPTYDLQTKSSSLASSPDIVLPNSYIEITGSFPEKLENKGAYLIPEGVTVELDNPKVLNNKDWSQYPPAATLYVKGTLKIKQTSSSDVNNKHFVVMPGGKLEAVDMKAIKMAPAEITTPFIYVMNGGELTASKVVVQDYQSMVVNGVLTCDSLLTYKESSVHVGGRLTINNKMLLNWNHPNYLHIYPNAMVEASKEGWISLAKITMHENSIFYTGSSMPAHGAEFIAPGNSDMPALVRVEGSYSYTQAYTFDGPIEVFIPNLKSSHKAILESRLSNGAYLVGDWEDRRHFIPWNEFNKGYGEFELIDRDGDGVVGNEDIDDEDPAVSSRSYFPSAGDYATIMFEDLWPKPGDYDMNDVVAYFNIYWTTNTQNKVTAMTFKWKMRAAGSQQKIAMGVQLDGVYTGEVATVSSTKKLNGNMPFQEINGLEPGQSKAVIPLFNDLGDVFDIRKMVNTYQNIDYHEANQESFTVTFKNPVDMSQVAENKINIFIVSANEEAVKRDNEIHLAGFLPTDKGRRANEEELDPNDNYKNKDGMVWGIMVPKSISYPLEGVNMEEAYYDFKSWYQSHGENNKDWYKSGRINSGKIYQEPVDTEE